MDSSLIFMLMIMFSIAIIGNILIHLTYRKQHKSFLSKLGNTDYYLSKNAKIEFEFISKFSMAYRFAIGDIVVNQNNIYILQKNKFIKQCMPILAFTNNLYATNFINTGRPYVISECYVKGSTLIIKSSKEHLVNMNAVAQIRFTDNTNISGILAQYDLNQKS